LLITQAGQMFVGPKLPDKNTINRIVSAVLQGSDRNADIGPVGPFDPGSIAAAGFGADFELKITDLAEQDVGTIFLPGGVISRGNVIIIGGITLAFFDEVDDLTADSGALIEIGANNYANRTHFSDFIAVSQANPYRQY